MVTTICGSHAEVHERTRSGYAAHQLQTCSLRKESAAEPANAQAETSASAITTHARYMLRCCRARPAFSREDARRRGSNTSTQQEPQRPRQHSTTAASPQRWQAARHAAGSLASTRDSAASASTIEKIWPSKTTTPTAASPDPCLDATNGWKMT